MSKRYYDYNLFDLRNKEDNVKHQCEYMLDRTMSMFKWEGLPNTIPQRSLELYFQVHGFVLLTKHEEDYCIYYGGLGGKPDYLYRPTIATIANPAQEFNAQLKIGWDKGDEECECVIGLNDPLLKGLIPLNEKHASQLAENELTLWLADILARMPWLLSSDDDRTKKSAEMFLQNIFSGKLGVVEESAFLEGIKEHILTNNAHQTINALVQLNQYYRANWFNELGLNAMQNGMKKEAISDSEEQMNQDILKPFITSMLECRQDFCDRVNERYGLNISVDLDSSWKDNEEELEIIQDQLLTEETQEEEVLETDDNTTDDTTVSDNDDNTDDDRPETDVEDIIQEVAEEIKETVEEIIEEENEEKEDE